MKIRINHNNFNVTSKTLTEEEVKNIADFLNHFDSTSYFRFIDEKDHNIIHIIPIELLKQSVIQLICEEGDIAK